MALIRRCSNQYAKVELTSVARGAHKGKFRITMWEVLDRGKMQKVAEYDPMENLSDATERFFGEVRDYADAGMVLDNVLCHGHGPLSKESGLRSSR